MNDIFQNQPTTKIDLPVECLGQTFSSDEARREHFIGLLAEKLKDPEFRKIEGFPIGTDEAILAMSNPPYYTACPNPWLSEFVEFYGKPYNSNDDYVREPMTVDVSVGKTHPIYKAHSYHTKVPHLAIVPSILHYTKPGDIVLDGFCGSGMTGVATQWCNTAPASYRHELEMEWKKQGKKAPEWGIRRVILNDLSPAATFIAANYNIPFDVEEFSKAGKLLLEETQQEIGWMYETLHSDGITKGRIEYTVWSEIFTCPECVGEINFLSEALEDATNKVMDTFPCPHCDVNLNKSNLERVFEIQKGMEAGESWKRIKVKPVEIVYLVEGKRYKKIPDTNDFEVLQRIEKLPFPINIPKNRFPIESMYHGSRIAPKGFSHIHHFFLLRAAHSMSVLWQKALNYDGMRIRQMLLFFVEQGISPMSFLNRFRSNQGSQSNQVLSGVYYIPSQIAEISVEYRFNSKLVQLVNTFRERNNLDGTSMISVGSSTSLYLQNSSIDYIFTDPPFGENIFYADLNLMAESWHGVMTDTSREAIIDKFKKKALPEYQHLMQNCFAEYYRVLKPGRWITIVFSNSKAAVWNAIQVALQQVGFVVAEVTALDKVQGSYRQVTSATAMKQDLVISAYKPDSILEDRFNQVGATPESAWSFVEKHLNKLPAVKITSGDFPELLVNIERDPRRIKDRMDAWFIRHGAMVPFSSPEFIAEVTTRFKLIDGMVFLPDQAVEYEKARIRIPNIKQAELFISDERSAIDWLSNFLLKRPSTRADVAHEYIPQIGSAKKKGELIPELDKLLDDNFLRYEGNEDVPSQIHGYLSSNYKDLRNLDKNDPALIAKAKDRWYVPDPNKGQDLEKKRDRALLKEFETYKASTGRKLKEFRLEVLRAGFRASWGNKDYQTIIDIAKKVPDDALQEDEKLLTLYDMALTRTEGN